MLGPSLLFFTTPFGVGYAYHAAHHARAKTAAWIGFVIAALEVLTLLSLMAIDFLS